MMHRPVIGMRPWTVVALAGLGVPRVVAHDLGLAGPVANSVLVFVPLALWVGWVLWRRVPPLPALAIVGVVYGILLAITHQLLWLEAFDGNPPELGGNLAGRFSPAAEQVVLRLASVGSSIVTGALLGTVTGIAAWVLARIAGRTDRSAGSSRW
ncbi:hypothetical protein [Nocardia carnea]|uniref:Uncharacterized protein n=1 Tax=Nocardia carnea TaxID=37328 RepID=A0ABW7TJT1_9NOCA|nr:hypothetical protein [Nocardia carnea]